MTKMYRQVQLAQKHFPKNIFLLRKLAGLTQADVANGILVTRTTYIGYEKGDACPSMISLVRLAAFFDCKLDDMILTEINEQKNGSTEKNRAT